MVLRQSSCIHSFCGFATALIDIISPPDPTRARDLNDVREAIDKLPPGPVRQALMSLVADTQKDLSEFQDKVEGWFNDSMDRASGWYKHRAQNILLCIALVLTVLLNVDTIKLAQSLWSNPVERQATVDLAQKYVDQNKAGLSRQNAGEHVSGNGGLTNLGQTDYGLDTGRCRSRSAGMRSRLCSRCSGWRR